MSTGTDLVDQVAGLAQPWASLYGNSPAVQTTVTFLHVAGIFLGGGFAIATDRETFIALRAARLSGQVRHLAHLHTIHRPVLLGLVIALGRTPAPGVRAAVITTAPSGLAPVSVRSDLEVQT